MILKKNRKVNKIKNSEKVETFKNTSTLQKARSKRMEKQKTVNEVKVFPPSEPQEIISEEGEDEIEDEKEYFPTLLSKATLRNRRKTILLSMKGGKR